VAGKTISIHSSEGGKFDCYVVAPKTDDLSPAVVLASAVHGVDGDIRAIADEFAAHGFIAAAPDLFWRSLPGPLSRDDERAAERSQPRLTQIRAGEDDMADTLEYLSTLSKFNGRAAAMGFCYGGPYAILGPKRLGYAAGISCHGTQMLDYIEELEGVTQPVCIIWGDQDHLAPIKMLDAFRDIASRVSNVELHIIPGVCHGFMMHGSPAAFNPVAREFSMERALALLQYIKPGRLVSA
jgi:carboxymethylenebutenolidase